MSTDAFGTQSRTAALDAGSIDALIAAHFPHVHGGQKSFFIEAVTATTATVRMKYQERHARPGGTISGPAMFTLLDVAVWAAVMAALGEAGVDAVTTHCNLHFLSRPAARDMLAKVTLLRVSRRSAVAECALYSEGSEELVAHGVAGYAIPTSSAGRVIPHSGNMIP
ncbi:MAG: PaaI family thioesterase [Hyphomicrobiaceae bacterium]|nr:PaaI family thioesterase [Hyphomicrobiaceae bacterium]